MNWLARNTRFSIGIALAVAVATIAATAQAAIGVGVRTDVDPSIHRNLNPHVLPVQSHAYGKTYGQWGAEWWKWAVSLPFDANPIFDPTGAFDEQAQNQIPWFLAGSSGGAGERTVHVPVGRPIFFPLVCIGNDYPCPDPTFEPAPGQTLEDFLAEGARALVDMACELSASVDGVAIRNVERYRAASGLDYWTEDPSLPPNWDPCGTGSPQPFVSDGYWIMLSPLTPGEHTIHFTGGITGWFVVDMTYHVIVGERHAAMPSTRVTTPATTAPLPVTSSWGQLKSRYR